MQKHRDKIKELKKMETWRYLRENREVCPECHGKLILLCFYEANSRELHRHCRHCRKELEKKEITRIVLETLKKHEL